MNWLDLVIIIYLILSFIEGLNKSIARELLHTLGFVLALLISFRIYPWMSLLIERMEKSNGISIVLGFVLSWLLIESLLIAGVLIWLSKWRTLRKRNLKWGLLAPILSWTRGVVFIVVIISCIHLQPVNPQLKLAVYNSSIASLALENVVDKKNLIAYIVAGLKMDKLGWMSVQPQSHQSIKLNYPINELIDRADLEGQMVELVNQEREKLGLKKLISDSALSRVAREHSRDMWIRQYFSHYTPEGKSVAERATEHYVWYDSIGENLALASSTVIAHQGLMNSTLHRDNILSNDYTKIGIGIVENVGSGLLVTQVYLN